MKIGGNELTEMDRIEAGYTSRRKQFTYFHFPREATTEPLQREREI